MLVIAHHTNINDPETFWAKAQTVVAGAPVGTKVHSVYPSQDGKTGTCVWEAGSVEEIQQFLDKAEEGIATNFCYEVNETAVPGHAGQGRCPYDLGASSDDRDGRAGGWSAAAGHGSPAVGK